MTLFKRHSKIFALCLVLVMVFTIGAISVSAKEMVTHDGWTSSCARIHGHANCEYCEGETTYVDYNANTGKSTPIYHYTRARIEHDILWWTEIVEDSGRKWDTDNNGYTFATTLDGNGGCADQDLIGRTYYGNEE